MTTALGLQDRCDVVLFEGREQLGGHILPHPVDDPRGQAAAVDTGFVVFVPETYRQFTALAAWLGVEHAEAVTKFRITDELRELSFPAADLLRLCGKRLPKECRRDLLRLYQSLLRIRREGLGWIDNVSLREWVTAQGYQTETVELGVVPWVASFWGLQPQTVLEVAAPVALREITRNAGPNPMHRVVPSTAGYLGAMVARLDRTEVRHQLVERITTSEGPRVHGAGSEEAFDRVVVATDAIDARRLLVDAPATTHTLLEPFRYEPTVAVVHRDPRYLPEDKAQWCTFHHRRRQDHDRTRSVTTWVLDLLHEWHTDPEAIGEPTLLTTCDRDLVDRELLDPAKTLAVYRHRHLVSTPAVLDAVKRLPQADEAQPFTLAGSYLRLGGLHEDALVSGVRAADKVRNELGLSPFRWPWASPE